MIDTDTSQILLPAKFHNFTISGLFFIHENKRVQFFYETRCNMRFRAHYENLNEDRPKLSAAKMQPLPNEPSFWQ